MRLGRKKKEIDQFSEKLEQALDALATGAEISVEEERMTACGEKYRSASRDCRKSGVKKKRKAKRINSR